MSVRKRVVLFPVGVLALVLLWSSMTMAGLLEDVQGLKLGIDGYQIGHRLTAAQKKIAAAHQEQGAYPGTYKFADRGLHVVADQKTDRVLALYRRIDQGDRTDMKAMVVELMDRFGEPTTMAHEKILYWAFDKKGLVSEERFNQAKQQQATAGLGIIATVKLNSDLEITPDQVDDGKEQAADTPQPKGTLYYIITSQPLVSAFVGQQ